MDNQIERCKYRMKKSHENYITAELLLKEGDYDTALNRAYYSIFHIINALLILDNLNFKSHSAVIAKFRETYIKTNIFDKNMSVIIGGLFEDRNDSDYTDFFWASKEDAEIQVENAKIFIDRIKPYIEKRIENL